MLFSFSKWYFFLAEETPPSKVLPGWGVKGVEPVVDQEYPVLLTGAALTTKLRPFVLMSDEKTSKVFIAH